MFTILYEFVFFLTFVYLIFVFVSGLVHRVALLQRQMSGHKQVPLFQLGPDLAPENPDLTLNLSPGRTLNLNPGHTLDLLGHDRVLDHASQDPVHENPDLDLPNRNQDLPQLCDLDLQSQDLVPESQDLVLESLGLVLESPCQVLESPGQVLESPCLVLESPGLVPESLGLVQLGLNPGQGNPALSGLNLVL